MNVKATLKSEQGRQLLKWAAVLILTAITLLIPVSQVYTLPLKEFLAITVFCIMLIAFDLMPTMIPCILLPVGYVLFEVAPAEVVFHGWSQPMPWMFLAVFIIANALTRTGLLERIAYASIVRLGGGFKRLAILILGLGLLLSLALPGGNAHVPLFFFVLGVCQAMGWKKSKETALLLVYTYLGTYTTIKFFLNPYLYLIAGTQSSVSMGNMSFFIYLRDNAVFLIWLVIAAVVAYRLLKPEGKMQSREYFKEKYRSLGPMTGDQKRAVAVTVLLIALIMTTNLHHIQMAWCFVLVCCIMYFPGIGFATQEDIRKANYSMVFFVAACMSIGSAGVAVGMSDMISAMLTPFLAQMGVSGFFLIILLMGFFGLFIMPPLAVLAVFTAPLTQIAVELGINPLPVWYTISISTNLIVFPYEYIAYKFGYSYNLIEMKDFVKVYLTKSLLLIAFTMLVALPYWRLIGIL